MKEAEKLRQEERKRGDKSDGQQGTDEGGEVYEWGGMGPTDPAASLPIDVDSKRGVHGRVDNLPCSACSR